MLRRSGVSVLVLTLAVGAGCNKSEGSKPPAFSGATPEISEVFITKERKHFECVAGTILELCCIDPPLCSCCCLPDQIGTTDIADQDLVTATARVTDPDGAADLLVVLLRFLDGLPGSTIKQISLEMFDTGQVDLAGDAGNQYSGDQTAGDGLFTRKFYFTSTNVASAGTCVVDTDTANLGGSFSNYSTERNIDPDDSLQYRFTVQAIDHAGNIATASEVPLAIQGIFEEHIAGQNKPCGPPSGNGGCLPGP